jgi:CheY-like chemotaxis protein
MLTSTLCDLSLIEAGSSRIFNRRQLDRRQSMCRETWAQEIADLVASVPAALRKLRVLVADDQRDATDGFARLVRCWGHEVRWAYDAAAALEVAAAQLPDVVFLDIGMPRLNGCGLAEQLRQGALHKNCLLIAVTGHADEPRRKLCAEAGIDLVLIKPVDCEIIELLLALESQRLGLPQPTAAAGAVRH